VFQQALALSEDERAELVASLPGPPDQDDADLTAAQRSELQRRFDDLDRGAVKAVPWPEAHAQLQARLVAARGSRVG
jgi:putative addiction module component (TIGR02574 family)